MELEGAVLVEQACYPDRTNQVSNCERQLHLLGSAAVACCWELVALEETLQLAVLEAGTVSKYSV